MEENTQEAGQKSRRKKLSTQEKYEIFLEAARGDIMAAEVIRRHGIHASDLHRIREKVRTGALKELGCRKNSKAAVIDPEQFERLGREKERLEKTLVEVTMENVLLKKKVD